MPPSSAVTMRLLSSSTIADTIDDEGGGPLSPVHYLPLLRPRPVPRSAFSLLRAAMDVLRSLLPISLQYPLVLPSCQWPPLPFPPAPVSPLRRRRAAVVAGTFFGHRKGRVSFAVQEDSRSAPVLLLELAMLTCDLVREMASGMVRILLECDRVVVAPAAAKKPRSPLREEPLWTMCCNGRRHGFAVARRCTGFDLHVLSMVRAISVGAGVLPPPPAPLPGREAAGSEVMYMRASFERVAGSKDSEAFYLINPESGSRRGSSDVGSGSPELCVFLLRI